MLVMGAPQQSRVLMPAVTRAVDIMVTSTSGAWPILCDIHDHILAGMIGKLQVEA
jgi:plastocyanin